MRVRVHKAGHDHASTGVEAWFVRIGGTQFVGFPYSDDLFIADEHGSVPDDAK